MQNFLGLLEHEEADFVDQVKKSKAFIQKIIKDKEDLGVVVANHVGKIKKLELERMDYQKRIIEAEREKRDFVTARWREGTRSCPDSQRFHL